MRRNWQRRWRTSSTMRSKKRSPQDHHQGLHLRANPAKKVALKMAEMSTKKRSIINENMVRGHKLFLGTMNGWEESWGEISILLTVSFSVWPSDDFDDNIDDDDFDLIEENLGIKVERKKKLKRVKVGWNIGVYFFVFVILSKTQPYSSSPSAAESITLNMKRDVFVWISLRFSMKMKRMRKRRIKMNSLRSFSRMEMRIWRTPQRRGLIVTLPDILKMVTDYSK